MAEDSVSQVSRGFRGLGRLDHWEKRVRCAVSKNSRLKSGWAIPFLRCASCRLSFDYDSALLARRGCVFATIHILQEPAERIWIDAGQLSESLCALSLAVVDELLEELRSRLNGLGMRKEALLLRSDVEREEIRLGQAGRVSKRVRIERVKTYRSRSISLRTGIVAVVSCQWWAREVGFEEEIERSRRLPFLSLSGRLSVGLGSA